MSPGRTDRQWPERLVLRALRTAVWLIAVARRLGLDAYPGRKAGWKTAARRPPNLDKARSSY